MSDRPRGTAIDPGFLKQAARRFRYMLLAFAGGFICVYFLLPLLRGDEETVFSSPIGWVPGTVSIAVALIAWGLTHVLKARPKRVVDFGLLFGVLGSYGIATAEYLREAVEGHLADLEALGLSWVAVWILFFAVVIPSRPRRSVLATILSAAAPAVLIGLAAPGAVGGMSAATLLSTLILPYVVVVLVSLTVSHMLYGLRREATKARQLGAYRLTDRLGEGSMGEVWRARHRLLSRPAAVKLVHPGLLRRAGVNPREVLTDFQREAQATSLLQSPHTVSIYDFGINDEGVFYYVMEMLDGLDLQSLVTDFGAVPPARTVHLLKHVCESLSEAHGEGLIHKDIKPANIYACRVGLEVDFAKVLDFGLVAFQTEQGEPLGPRAVRGSPGYMSPEQIRGEQIDERSDIYAIGCVAYQLLTHRHVFGGSFEEIMKRHVEEAPPRPSSRSERPLPPDLDELIMKCLDKDPAKRVQTTPELRERLDAIRLEDRWTPQDAAAWWEEHGPPKRSVEALARVPMDIVLPEGLDDVVRT